MKISLEALLLLTERYKSIAEEKLKSADGERKEQLKLMVDTLSKIPFEGATSFYEAIQSYILLWQTMCLEQAPNPFAFSVGNADRIFEPYRGELSREEASELFKHFRCYTEGLIILCYNKELCLL